MNDGFSIETRARLARLLQEFERRKKTGPFEYSWAHHHDGGHHQTHIVFGCMIHGNEFGSLPAAVRLVQALTDGSLKFGGRLTIFIGNPEAALENRRYLEADLNRVFLDTGKDQHEHRRAQAIMPILKSADVFLDFHQTILNTTQPFYIFPWHTQGWLWARAIQGTNVWVTRDPKKTFSSGSQCSDEYVTNLGRPGMTLELSQKGFSDAAESLCWNAMLRTLNTADAQAAATPLRLLAERQPELKFLTTTFAERFDTPNKALLPGLINFQQVRQGQMLHAAGSPEITVPENGLVLFPKYPERDGTAAIAPWPNELYRLVAPMAQHPRELWEENGGSEDPI